MTETTEIQDPAGSTVFYDGACGMCLRTVARLRTVLEPRGFRFEAFPAGVAMVELKLRCRDGMEQGGADTLLTMARTVWWLWPCTTLALLPGVKPLLRRAYRKVAARRHGISGACGWTPPRVAPLPPHP